MILIHGERVAEHETEWGVRVPDGDFEADDKGEAEFLARGMRGKLLRREHYVTVWLEVA